MQSVKKGLPDKQIAVSRIIDPASEQREKLCTWHDLPVFGTFTR
jgi:hypothetical protein